MDALRGIWLTLKTPRLWGLCLAPLAGAVLTYLLLGVGGYLLLAPRLAEWLDRFGFGGRGWLTGAEVAAAVVWALLFPFLFVALAGAFAGLIFEPLSIAVEQVESGTSGEVLPPPRTPLAPGALFRDSLARLVLNGLLGLAALLLSFVAGPIPGVIAAAIIGLLDYTSPAYLRRGMTLGPQWRRLKRPLDGNTLLFALLAGLLSLTPFVGVLLLPGLIAGATLLVRRRELAAVTDSGASGHHST